MAISPHRPEVITVSCWSIERNPVPEKRGIPLKSDAGIFHELAQQLLEKSEPFGLTSALPLPVEEIIVAEWVNLKCLYGCKHYNSNWCCPPATPSTDKVRSILKDYSQALLLSGSNQSSDLYQNKRRKRANQVRCWKGIVSIERMLFLKGYHKAFSLLGKSCNLCKTCAYPKECKFPQEKRPSMKSFSIDIIGTLKNLSTTSVDTSGVNADINYYGIVLVE